MLDRYLVKNAEIIDVFTGKHTVSDVYVEHGVVSAIGQGLQKEGAEVINAKGMLMTPGWFDSHAHFFYDHGRIGIDPQMYWVCEGVTYAIDQGSAGADNYEEFRKYVRYNTDLKFKSFLNMAKIGMPIVLFELTDFSLVDQEAFYRCYERYADELVGLKLRISEGMCNDPKMALKLARTMADHLHIPISIHETRVSRLPADDIFNALKEGDYVQHSYAKSVSGILDENGKIRDSVWAARERGVHFDMGHGIGSLDFNVAKAALDQGFELEAISSDLHCAGMAGPVFDLATSISKFLALGYTLGKAMYMVTVAPTQMMGIKDKTNTIRVGERADFTLFRVESGDFTFTDSTGNTLQGKERIKVCYTGVGEKVFTPRIVKAKENEPIGAKARSLQKMPQKV